MKKKRIFFLPSPGIGDMVLSIPLVNRLKRYGDIYIPLYPFDQRIEMIEQLALIPLTHINDIAEFEKNRTMRYDMNKKAWQNSPFDDSFIKYQRLKRYYDQKVNDEYLNDLNFDMAIIHRNEVTAPSTNIIDDYTLQIAANIVVRRTDIANQNVHTVDLLLEYLVLLGLENLNSGAKKNDYVMGLDFKDDRLHQRLQNILSFHDYIVINLSNGRISKKWPWPYYKHVANRLVLEGLTVILVGDQATVNEGKAISEHCRAMINLTGTGLGLIDFAKLANRARAVISSDNGLMHIADFTQTKVFGIFGPTDPNIWGPYFNRHLTVPECEAYKRQSMDSILPEDVVVKILNSL